MIHNTPFGDIVDTEDDLQPYLYKGLKRRFVFLYDECSDPNDESRRRNVKKSFHKHAITITDFADVLTKNYEIPFRHAHHAASAIANMSLAEKELHELHFKDVNMYLQEHFKINVLEKEWKEIISPEALFKRNVYGGPSKKK